MILWEIRFTTFCW